MLDCTSNRAVGRHSIFNNTGRIFNLHLTQPNRSFSLYASLSLLNSLSFRRTVHMTVRRFLCLNVQTRGFLSSLPLSERWGINLGHCLGGSESTCIVYVN